MESSNNVNSNLERKSKVFYPSSKILFEATYQDYIRLIGSYDKIYDKLNIMLAFIGLILGAFITAADFSVFSRTLVELTATECSFVVIHFISIIVCVILFLLSIIKSLVLISGKSITVCI